MPKMRKFKFNDGTEVKEEQIDYESLFTQANLEGGKKIAKQCVACHSFDNSMKIKVGPPLWNIVGRKSAGIDGFKYSKALTEYKKNWSINELFYFFENLTFFRYVNFIPTNMWQLKFTILVINFRHFT